MFPGITDDPHLFTPGPNLITDVINYFTSKPGLPSDIVSGFAAAVMEMQQRLSSNDPSSLDAMDEDISPSGMSTTVYRFREGIERFLITDINNPAASAQAQSSLSVLSDTINADMGDASGQFNHLPGGSNVLYMDGHVEFVKYPGPWPVSPLIAALVGEF